MRQARDYTILIRELLAGAVVGWSYKHFKSWLREKEIDDREFAQWLRENGAALCEEPKIRSQLTSVVMLGWDELAEAASEILQQSKPLTTGLQKILIRGNNLIAAGKNEEAIVNYDIVLKSDPNSAIARSNRGAALSNLGQHEEAIANYDRAIDLKYKSHLNWFNRGMSLFCLGRFEEAIVSFNRSIELEAKFELAWANKSSALGNLGEFEEALFLLRSSD